MSYLMLINLFINLIIYGWCICKFAQEKKYRGKCVDIYVCILRTGGRI